MTKRNLLSILLVLSALTLSQGLIACGDDDLADECDPAASATCVCTDDDTGATCDPETDDNCTCEDSAQDLCAEVTCGDGEACEAETGQCIPEGDAGCQAGSGQQCVCLDGNGEACAEGADGCTCTAETAYRFVLIEDMTANVSGEYPGVDLDAIGVTPLGASEALYATTVEDFNLGAGSALDTAQVLGAPDAACDANSGKFVALGGQAADGFIIVGFSSDAQDVTFSKGAQITAHEVGVTECPGSTFDDDPYNLSISVSSDRDTFTQIGEAAQGTATIAVP